VEFIQDPSVPIPNQSTWLAYYHGSTAPEELKSFILSNLHAIHGNSAYLIQRGGTAGVNFPVSGEPVIPSVNWKPNSFNLTGFHLAAGGEPTYSDFFSSSPAHAGQEVWVLRNNAWIEAAPAELMKHGEAFWVFCEGSSKFNGPVSIQLGNGGSLEYGKVLDELELIITNRTTSSRRIVLAPTSGGFPLYYWNFDPASSVASWEEISNLKPLSISIGNDSYGKGKSQRIRLGVKRVGLSPDQVVIANLAITDLDGYGTNIILPASVTGVSYSGLWSGYATLNKVEEARKGDNIPVYTDSELSMRLLIHVDAGFQASLLQQVIQMWQEGALINDPENLGKKIVDPNNPGHFVLLAEDSHIPYFSGAALLDSRPVGKRISSAAFGNFYEMDTRPEENLELYSTFQKKPYKVLQNGTFQLGATLNVTLWLPADDPSNPFIHKYNPDHLPPEKKEDPLGSGIYKWNQAPEKMFDITRNITFEFRETDAEDNLILGAGDLDWGSSKVGGIYTENITGLHKDIITTSGTFILEKISDVQNISSPAVP
jgi:hypothetical protein